MFHDFLGQVTPLISTIVEYLRSSEGSQPSPNDRVEIDSRKLSPIFAAWEHYQRFGVPDIGLGDLMNELSKFSVSLRFSPPSLDVR